MQTSERKEQAQRLSAIACKPLEHCPHFPDLARKWEQWWRLENEHPLLTAFIDNPKATGFRSGKLLDLLDTPSEWLDEREKQLAAQLLTKDTLPNIRTDIGPVSVGAFLGAPLHLKPGEETAWQDPIISDWDLLPPLDIKPDNEWFQRVMHLAATTAERARGRYVVCTSDLSGPIDILANLRGSECLCLDLFEERDHIIEAAQRLVDAWEHAYNSYLKSVLGRGAGLIQWVGAWSNEPYTTPTCDFNALIGPTDFEEVCLPAYEEQCRRAGRACFHLDGPDAARHHAALAKSNLTAIQFTPGAGTPSALPHIPMFKEFLDAGKPVMIAIQLNEVDTVLKALGTKGVALMVEGCRDIEDFGQLDKKSGW